MLYGCETWTVTKPCESRILSFERKCYRKILRIGWTQKVTNEKLYRKIQLAETLLQKVIQRKLRIFGHICRMNDSRKWCGATLQELSHAALNRQRWAAIVRMASDTKGHWAHGCRWWWWWWRRGTAIAAVARKNHTVSMTSVFLWFSTVPTDLRSLNISNFRNLQLICSA